VLVDAGRLVGVLLGVTVGASVGKTTVGVSGGDPGGPVAAGVPIITGTVAGDPSVASGSDVTAGLSGTGVSAASFLGRSLVGVASELIRGALHASDSPASRKI
jgi:hypothetical protein